MNTIRLIMNQSANVSMCIILVAGNQKQKMDTGIKSDGDPTHLTFLHLWKGKPNMQDTSPNFLKGQTVITLTVILSFLLRFICNLFPWHFRTLELAESGQSGTPNMLRSCKLAPMSLTICPCRLSMKEHIEFRVSINTAQSPVWLKRD